MLTSAEAIRLLRVLASAADAELEESHAEGRTTVTLTLPNESEVKSVTRDNPSIKPSKCVLHVEDGDRAADLTYYYLRDLYSVEAAQDAEEALELALEKTYDVILMDMNLGPGMSGFELTRMLRQMTQYARTPIVALTGYASRKDAERCIEAGCTAYLAKPFLKEDLVKLLRDIEKAPQNK